MFGSDADPGIVDAKNDPTVRTSNTQTHSSAGARIADGIVEQNGEQPLQAICISRDKHRPMLRLHSEIEVLKPHSGLPFFPDMTDKLVGFYRLKAKIFGSRVYARKHEQAVDQT